MEGGRCGCLARVQAADLLEAIEGPDESHGLNRLHAGDQWSSDSRRARRGGRSCHRRPRSLDMTQPTVSNPARDLLPHLKLYVSPGPPGQQEEAGSDSPGSTTAGSEHRAAGEM